MALEVSDWDRDACIPSSSTVSILVLGPPSCFAFLRSRGCNVLTVMQEETSSENGQKLSIVEMHH